MSVDRFIREMNGDLGPFWKKNAEAELNTIRDELRDGKITIDDSGIARNCIGRVLMNDMAYKVSLVTDEIDLIATADAREDEVAREIAEYKESMKNHVYSDEELYEMRCAFGEGASVVDIFTGEVINL